MSVTFPMVQHCLSHASLILRMFMPSWASLLLSLYCFSFLASVTSLLLVPSTFFSSFCSSFLALFSFSCVACGDCFCFHASNDYFLPEPAGEHRRYATHSACLSQLLMRGCVLQLFAVLRLWSLSRVQCSQARLQHFAFSIMHSPFPMPMYSWWSHCHHLWSHHIATSFLPSPTSTWDITIALC